MANDPTDPNTLTFKDSSNVRGAAFDPATGVVEVTFSNNKKYRYANFSHELLLDWATAPSAGAWFNAEVKSNPDKHPVVTDGQAPTQKPPAAPAASAAASEPAPAAPAAAKAKAPPAPPAKKGSRTVKDLMRLKPWRGIGNGCTTTK